MANPCADFIDEESEPKVYFSPEAGFCIIDRMLADKAQFVEKKTMHTEIYGPVEFLRSVNGNVAMVSDVLAMAGIIEHNTEVRPQFAAIITAIVSCFSNPTYRDRIVDAGKWAAVSLAGNALWEGVKWIWDKIFD